jgi:hypothetical protein
MVTYRSTATHSELHTGGGAHHTPGTWQISRPDTHNIPTDEANDTVSSQNLIRGDSQRDDSYQNEGERMNTQHTLGEEDEHVTTQHGSEAGRTPHLNRATITGKESALKWSDDMKPDKLCESDRGEEKREPARHYSIRSSTGTKGT